MKENERMIKSMILGAIASAIFWYLVGSFYSVSFDISKWSEETRFILSMFFSLGTMFSLPIIASYFEQKK